MRSTAFIFCLSLGVCVLRAGESTTAVTDLVVHLPSSPEAEALLTPEALARYFAPGDPSRYTSLAERLEVPAETLGPPARNLRLPVQSFSDGRPRTLVFAREAWVAPDMQYLRGRAVRVECLREDGSTEATLEAEEIAVDRTTMLAMAKGRVRSNYDGDRLDGMDALADLNARYVEVLRDACITTKRLGEANFADRGMF